jgi:flavocytochrome c
MRLRSLLVLAGVLAGSPLHARQSREADVIVVGAGIAGLSAALEAARGGASVLVVDLWSIFGGHAVLSHGGLAIVGTPVQEAQGVLDTPDLAARDFLEWGEDANEPWVRYYAANSREQVYDWLTSMGVQFSGALRIPGNSVARFHEPVGRGLGLVSPIYRHAVQHPGIRFLWNFKVDSLVIEEGRVSGVEGVHLRSSERETLGSDFVVLATGGFQSNLDMVRSFWPKDVRFPERLLAGSGLNSLGFGHRVAEKSGAVLYQMDHQWNYATGLPDPRYPDGKRGLNASNDDSIWVNASGKRFVNEQGSNKEQFAALLAQEGSRYWAIFDEKAKRQFSITGSDWADFRVIEETIFANPELVRSAPTLEALAQAAGIPRDALADTVARYNQMVRDGADKDFGRRRLEGEIATPPFYAAAFYPLARKSMGGIRIDTDSRVLDKDQKPIPGFLAAGEVTGFGGINGKAGLEGTFLGPSIVTGRVAGRTILKEMAKSKSLAGVPESRPPAPPTAGEEFENETCETCHDLPTLVATSRPGYSHFEKVHRVVMEKTFACRTCHEEMFPIDLDRHRIDALRQIDACKNCHVATER